LRLCEILRTRAQGARSLGRNKNNNSGMGPMKKIWPAGTLRSNRAAACWHWLATGSLILFMFGSFAERAWVLLNSDLGQLVRRLH
jgi:hypothetical protein